MTTAPLSSPWRRRLALLACATSVGLFASGCESSAADPPPPPRLATALGDLELSGARPAADDPRELWTYDLEPFVQAGLEDARALVPGLVRELLAARAAALGERPGDAETAGSALLVRAEPGSLKVVQAFLERLEAEKTQPLTLEVHVVTAQRDALAFLDRAEGAGAALEGFVTSLPEALARGEVRTLVRRRLELTPGVRRSLRQTSTRRPVVRIEVEGGRPSPRQESVEDGLALHAACWLGGRGRAVAHLEFAEQRESSGETPRTLSASFRPGGAADAIEAAIDLPRLRMLGLRGQLELERGRWQILAGGPGYERGRRVAALVRATWRQRPAPPLPIAPGLELRSLRIALPQGAASSELDQEAQGTPFFGSTMLGGRVQNVMDGLKVEYTRQRLNGVKNVGLGFFSGEALQTRTWTTGVVEHGHPGWRPLLPAGLARQRRALEDATWPRAGRLLSGWDQLHVIQTSEVAAQIGELCAGVEAWRNEPVRVHAEWLELTPAQLASLGEGASLAEALPGLRGGGLPSFWVTARSGAWTELSLSERDAVLWGFLGDDRPSPELGFVPRGVRLSLRPRRYGSGRVEVRLRFGRDEASELTPVARAGGRIHRPRTRQVELEQVLTLADGVPQLVLAREGAAGRPQVLAVTAWH